MSVGQRSRLFHVLAGLTASRLAIFFLLLLPVASGFRGKLADPDLWWHLKAGEWIVEHRAVPWNDPFSYTAAGQPWIAYSWLAEVLFFELARTLGYHALIYLKSAAALALMGFVYLSARTAGARRPAASLTSALVALATVGAWSERPQLLSLVLLAALVWILQSEEKRRRLVWLGPLLVALWANVHILFFVGVGLLGLAALCESIERRPSGRLWSATALSAAATLGTPYGWRLLAHVPTMIHQPAIGQAVAEFRSPDFGTLLGLLIGLFVIASIVVIALSRERLTLFELVTFAGSLAMGLYMIRNIPIFAILAAPTLARRLDGLLPAASPLPEHAPPPALLGLHYALLVGGILLAGALAPHGRGWRENLAPELFPAEAADFVAERYSGARLFNDFDWGGFLIFRLTPKTLVSIDGRTQLYGEQILGAYTRTHYILNGWEKFLKSCRPDIVLWPRQSPLAQVLRELPKWRVVYEDKIAVIFERVEMERARSRASLEGERHLASAGMMLSGNQDR